MSQGPVKKLPRLTATQLVRRILAEKAKNLPHQLSTIFTRHNERRTIPLTQLFARSGKRQRQMAIVRQRSSQTLVEIDLTRCRSKQIGPTDDLGDPCIHIIDNDRELIRKLTISAMKNKVTEFRLEILRSRSENTIHEGYRSIDNAQADRRLRTLPFHTGTTGSRVNRTIFSCMRSAGQNLATGTVAVKEQIRGPQQFKNFTVASETLTLTDNRAVPGQPQGFQQKKHLVRSTGHNARRIKIFDSDPPGSACLPGHEIAAQGGDQGSKMHGTGRAWRKTPDDGHILRNVIRHQ